MQAGNMPITAGRSCGPECRMRHLKSELIGDSVFVVSCLIIVLVVGRVMRPKSSIPTTLRKES